MSDREDTEPELVWVEDAAGMAALVARMHGVPAFAIDTESNSMHAYRERICLVQISWPGVDAIVDGLAVDLTALRDVLADPGVEKVMHGADYDVLCLRRQLDLRLANLFDTMIAARVLRWPKCGLGPILEERFSVRVDKRMQRFDWGRRPLPREAIDYARLDTRFLLELRAQQAAELDADPDRADVFGHACARQATVEPRAIATTPDPWRLTGFRKLPARTQAIAAALVELREAIARELDRPLFKVMPDEELILLAQKPPRDRRELAARARLHPRLRRQEASRVLAAIAGAEDAEPPPRPPEEPRPEPVLAARYDALRTWRKKTAEAGGLEPDLVLSRAALSSIALVDPGDAGALAEIPELDAWERARYGESILACLAAARRQSGAGSTATTRSSSRTIGSDS